MNLHKLYSIFFLPLIISLLTIVVATGCSDDDEALQSQYGYVQFKLYKSTSFDKGTVTRSVTDKLESLSSAQKIMVVMTHNGTTVSQTLPLNAYNANNAEYGLRSDKLQLLAGTYKIIGYYLYDKLDKVLLAGPAGEDNEFTVVSGGLQEQTLTVDAVSRGTVTFKLTKEGLSTRAVGEYLFSNIRFIDVTVMNTFTRVTTGLKGMKVTYEEDSKENQNPDNVNDKYMDIGVATCDSAVWLPAGTYQVVAYTTYSQSGSTKPELETQSVRGEPFIVEDNKLTEDANVPIQLKETAEYIKDYKALKAIWEALDGKNWKYNSGIVDNTVHPSNWNFNKELDMWGDQPGVDLDANGRVTGLSLAGFGAKGRVPDAIGQLTELKTLAFGTHGETLSGRLFGEDKLAPDMTEEQKQRIRMHYKRMFLDYDPRLNMSELLQDGINRHPKLQPIKKDNRITLKDTQIGGLTNRITFISKAVQRLTKLQNLYLANSPITYDNIATDWEDATSEYAKQYADEELSWSNLKDLTDVELYNCPKLTQIPEFVYDLPELQLLNVACNKGISADQLTADWKRLADDEDTGPKVQILYLGYNNLEKFPESESLRKMVKLGLLDCVHNNVNHLEAFGTDVKLSDLMLSYNQIEEIPDEFCAFTDQVEGLGFSHNKLKYIPNIFNANSVYVMGSVDFSYNEIGSEGSNIKCSMDQYKGINASTVTLSYNKIKKFPTELFASGSPISTIDLSNNLMTSIPENSLKPKNGNYKNTYLLTIIDLRFNKLTSLSDDFRATTLPYLSNMDVSYNCFSKFPTQPLNSSQLKAFGIRHQRDAEGNRILREWPTGITTCPSLIQLQIGSNDIRKVDEKLTPQLYILDIGDNPNISIDVTSVCPYIEAGMYVLIYDTTQDIRGCDALGIER
ncbi:DUF4458 domain-containing protein [Bacteroides faecis]|uniref:DUF4458 domain-containing protein n=1 Tax=Bacteroides faecis TaxID=674529 RepID=UPI0032EB67EB